jgi:hypothetical protein
MCCEVADKDGQAIRKVTPEGLIQTVAGTNEAGDDESVTLDAFGRMIITENDAGFIRTIDFLPMTP